VAKASIARETVTAWPLRQGYVSFHRGHGRMGLGVQRSGRAPEPFNASAPLGCPREIKHKAVAADPRHLRIRKSPTHGPLPIAESIRRLPPRSRMSIAVFAARGLGDVAHMPLRAKTGEPSGSENRALGIRGPPSVAKHWGETLAWAILRGQSFKKIFGQEMLPRHCVLGGAY